MMTVRRFTLLFVLLFAVGSTAGCLVHVRGGKRAGNSCGKNKVWVKRNGVLKCKHRHHKRGHEKRHKKEKSRDHRK